MCAGGCKPRLGRDWERGGPGSLGQHYKKGLLGPAHPPTPGRPAFPHSTGCEPSPPQNASGLWRSSHQDWVLTPSVSCPCLVPSNQAVSSFKGPGLSSSGPPRIPDPSLVLPPSRATCPLWPCCPRNINPAQKDYPRNASAHVRESSSAPRLLGVESGGVTLLAVSPPALYSWVPH